MANVRSWRVLLIRTKSEKKVVDSLKRKGIEFYCPYFSRKSNWENKKKLSLQPIFESLIFVYVNESEQSLITHVDGAINLLYWLDNPATILTEEIEAIQLFLETHEDITVEKINMKTDGAIAMTLPLHISKVGAEENEDFINAKINILSLGLALVSASEPQSIKSVA